LRRKKTPVSYALICFIEEGLGRVYNQVIVTIGTISILRVEPTSENPVLTEFGFDTKITPFTVPVVLVGFLLFKGILDLFLNPRSKVSWEPVNEIEGDQGRIPEFIGNLFRASFPDIIPTPGIDPTEKRPGPFEPYQGSLIIGYQGIHSIKPFQQGHFLFCLVPTFLNISNPAIRC
jgi:hypothetical protein